MLFILSYLDYIAVLRLLVLIKKELDGLQCGQNGEGFLTRTKKRHRVSPVSSAASQQVNLEQPLCTEALLERNWVSSLLP